MLLKELYKKEILPKLKEEFGIKNDLAAPRLDKVVINVGFGKHNKDKALIKSVVDNLATITGQKIVLNKARKAISAFKIREGMIIGAKVTLRGKRMYDFVEKLINIYFPRIRDFRGIDLKGVDKEGNITIGFKELSAFPEIREKDLDNPHGLEISIATTARNKERGQSFFKLMNFPFKK